MFNDDEKKNKLKVIQFDKHKNTLVESLQPQETFDDVGGLEDVKKKIRMNFILPLQNPEFFKAYGKEAGGKPPFIRTARLRENLSGKGHSRGNQRQFFTYGITGNFIDVCWTK